VSVTDQLSNQQSKAWSAFYCFYDPDYRAFSLGKYAILTQLKLAEEFAVDWLYLGYYIEKCQKMNYKTQFNPHQRLINRRWIDFNHAVQGEKENDYK
ncbi:MAG: arginyltransferase, partial [Psychromonas sp.]|nr:arginyltransferase [Psychromonas sp.]